MGAETARVYSIEELAAQADYRLDLVLQRIGMGGTEWDKVPNAEFEAAVDAKLGELKKEESRKASDILLGKPLIISIGGIEYSIKPLTMAEDVEWRGLANALFKKTQQMYQGAKAQPENKEELISAAVREFPNDVIEMFWAYCPELKTKRPVIESSCNFMQVAAAACEVLRYTSPFFAMTDQLAEEAIKALLPTESQ